MAFGALTFALACSHLGIFTRVVFMEDGIYSLSGRHKLGDTDPVLNIQSVITATSGTCNLDYYGYVPSFRERGISGSSAWKGVQMIDPAMLAQIFFKAPGGVFADYQRVLIF
jgi:tRNA 2-thiouridine synthesizing protein C